MILDLPPGPLQLLADHSILLPESRTLILADTHFGKSAAFRARGLPVPEGDTVADLARIDALLSAHQPKQLVIAGDILHAKVGCTPEVLGHLQPWLESCPAQPLLVEGNHDSACGKNPLGEDFPFQEELTIDSFHILHNPDEELENPSGFHIGGHLHPVVRIKDGTANGFRVPAFWLRGNQLVLPAFGSFTGGKTYAIDPKTDRIFTPLNSRVLEISPQFL